MFGAARTSGAAASSSASAAVGDSRGPSKGIRISYPPADSGSSSSQTRLCSASRSTYRPSCARVAAAGCSAPCNAGVGGLFSGRGSGCASLRIPSGTTIRLGCTAEQAQRTKRTQPLFMAM